MFGLVGAIWFVLTLPALWSAPLAKDVVARILAKDRFKVGALKDVLKSMRDGQEWGLSRGEEVRARALVQLRIVEELEAKASEYPDALGTEVSLRSALLLNPADSFLWLMLYSLENSRNGFDAKSVDLLAQSYATGPLEAWIALQRNRIALAVFPALGMTTQQEILFEFSALVESRFIEDAALNLTTAGWQQRDRLLMSLTQVDLASRKALARRIFSSGVAVDVPGVQIDERWWR